MKRSLTLHLGSRSDANGEFGRTSPRTVFDIERDAEIQETHRLFNTYKAETDLYQGRMVLHFMWFARLAGVLVLAASVGSFVLGLALNSLFWPQSESTPSADQVAATATVTKPAPVLAESAPVATDETVGKAETPPNAPVPASVLARPSAAKDFGASPSAPAVATTKPTNPAQQPKAKIGAATSKTAVPAPGKPGQVDSAEHTAQKQPTPAQGGKVTPEEKVFSLEESAAPSRSQPDRGTVPASVPTEPPPRAAARADVSSPLSKTTIKETTVEATRNPVTKSGAKPVAAPAPDQVQREKYGSSGVITITPGGVVVYDRERKAHRMVTVGGILPDGSTLKAVDAKTNRISTDRGDTVFD